MNPFARLGVEPKFSVDLSELERVHRELSRALHPDKHTQGLPAERRKTLDEAVAVNEAWRIVRDPLRRAEAILALRGMEAEGADAKPSPAFLMDMLQLREELEGAKTKGAAALGRLAAKVEGAFERTRDRLAAALDEGNETFGSAPRLLAELRFQRRLLDEIASLEDD
jgi:molecular chaperone HscB